MKNKKIIIGVVLILLIAVLIYNLNKKPKVLKKEDAKAPASSDPNAIPKPSSTTPSFDGYGGHDGMYGGGEDNYVVDEFALKTAKTARAQAATANRASKKSSYKKGVEDKRTDKKSKYKKSVAEARERKKQEVYYDGSDGLYGYTGDNILQAGAEAAAEPTN